MKMTRQRILRIAVIGSVTIGLMVGYCGWTWWRVTGGGDIDFAFRGVSFQQYPHSHWQSFNDPFAVDGEFDCVDWSGSFRGWPINGHCSWGEVPIRSSSSFDGEDPFYPDPFSTESAPSNRPSVDDGGFAE